MYLHIEGGGFVEILYRKKNASRCINCFYHLYDSPLNPNQIMKFLEIHTSKFSMNFVYGVHLYPKGFKCLYAIVIWLWCNTNNILLKILSLRWTGIFKVVAVQLNKKSDTCLITIGREPKNHLSGSIFESSEILIWSMTSSSPYHHTISIFIMIFFFLFEGMAETYVTHPREFKCFCVSSGCWNASSDSFQPIFCCTWCWCEGRPSTALISGVYICSLSIII